MVEWGVSKLATERTWFNRYLQTNTQLIVIFIIKHNIKVSFKDVEIIQAQVSVGPTRGCIGGGWGDEGRALTVPCYTYYGPLYYGPLREGLEGALILWSLQGWP